MLGGSIAVMTLGNGDEGLVAGTCLQWHLPHLRPHVQPNLGGNRSPVCLEEKEEGISYHMAPKYQPNPECA